MDRVVKSSLFKKVNEDCGMEMPMEMEDCCDDEWSLEIIEDEQQLSDILQTPKGSFFVIYEIRLPEFIFGVSETAEKPFLTAHGPPNKVTPPLYVYYHSLKIPSDLQS